jgi:hypothetical protein
MGWVGKEKQENSSTASTGIKEHSRSGDWVAYLWDVLVTSRAQKISSLDVSPIPVGWHSLDVGMRHWLSNIRGSSGFAKSIIANESIILSALFACDG